MRQVWLNLSHCDIPTKSTTMPAGEKPVSAFVVVFRNGGGGRGGVVVPALPLYNITLLE